MNKIPTIPDAFSFMLLEFNTLIEKSPEPEKIKDKLLKLKEDAENSVELNSRQKDAVIERCQHYISGEYGKLSPQKEAYLKNQIK